MKRYLIVVTGVLPVFLLLFIGCKRCYVCDKEAKYDTIYVNQPDKCSYVIFKKRQDDPGIIPWGNKSTLLEKFRPVDTMVARQYIQAYNEKYNTDLKNTAFIDFSTNELLAYLIEVTSWAQHNSANFDMLRIYLATDGSGKNTVVLAATTAEEGDFIKNENFKPVDYGSLCPPPDGCYETKKAELLKRAISLSDIIGKPKSIKQPMPTKRKPGSK